MKRRMLNGCALGAAALVALPAFGRTLPVAGRQYLPADPTLQASASGVVEVAAFFSYGSRACFLLEDALVQWQTRLPANAILRRMPVSVWDDFIPLQDLYFAIQTLGLTALHREVFLAIQKHRTRLETEDQVGAFVARHGVDRERFLAVFNSDEVAAKTDRATELASLYRIRGTPAIGIGGRWMTDPQLAGSPARMLDVADWLIGRT